MRPRSVLVVDDETPIRELLRRFLEDEGFRVETAADGVQALARLEAASFDIVMSDLDMPNLGGTELVARLKAKSPEAIAIILTGYPTLDTVIAALQQGCDDYLMKPVNLALVRHSIDRCWERRNARLAALTALKIGRAREEALSIVCEEIGDRMAEWADCLARIEEVARADDSSKLVGIQEDLRAVYQRFECILDQSERIRRTISEKGQAPE